MAKTAHQLDRRVSILSPTTTRDADGAPATTYSVTSSRWARKEEAGGRELRVAGQLRAETSAVFTFRYFTTLTEQHRLQTSDNRVWDILAINEAGRKQWTMVQAREREGQT